MKLSLAERWSHQSLRGTGWRGAASGPLLCPPAPAQEPLPLSEQLLPLDFTAGSQNLPVLGWSTASPLPTAPAGILGLCWLSLLPSSAAAAWECPAPPHQELLEMARVCSVLQGDGVSCVVSLFPGGMVLIRPVLKT